jgi:hypothetical protein
MVGAARFELTTPSLPEYPAIFVINSLGETSRRELPVFTQVLLLSFLRAWSVAELDAESPDAGHDDGQHTGQKGRDDGLADPA